MSFDRYAKVRMNGTIGIVPSITIPKSGSDYYETFERGKMMLNDMSYRYYGNPNYDWLIMLANPEYGSMEFNIPEGAELRIPYPLQNAIQYYNSAIDNYNRLYK